MGAALLSTRSCARPHAGLHRSLALARSTPALCVCSTTPDYYKVVSEPIDFARIAQKAKTEEYATVAALTDDVRLLCDNARAFYPESSAEHADACLLWTAYNEIVNRVVQRESSPASVRSVHDRC